MKIKTIHPKEGGNWYVPSGDWVETEITFTEADNVIILKIEPAVFNNRIGNLVIYDANGTVGRVFAISPLVFVAPDAKEEPQAAEEKKEAEIVLSSEAPAPDETKSVNTEKKNDNENRTAKPTGKSNRTAPAVIPRRIARVRGSAKQNAKKKH